MLDELTSRGSYPKGGTKMECHQYCPILNNSIYKWVYPNNLLVTTGNVYPSAEGKVSLKHYVNQMVIKNCIEHSCNLLVFATGQRQFVPKAIGWQSCHQRSQTMAGDGLGL